ncbi:MAG: hypothetical protein HYY60_02530 [Parcubacteria group bacterium]|nr:hypothetical protein [Parcubacteria group bacterium]
MKKLEALSQISRDIGQVLFASTFVSPIIENAFNKASIAYGLLLTLSAWFLSILLTKE